MDFQKAFDKVPHKRMISKLKRYVIENPILSLIENYLADRKQKIIINGKSSEWKDVTFWHTTRISITPTPICHFHN